MTSKIKIESGVQLLARLQKKPSLDSFYPKLFQSGPAAGDVIEIFGDCCTSHLLVDIITEALIQTTFSGVPAGIILFNTDGPFDFQNLIDVLRKKVHESGQVETTVSSMLDNLLILSAYDKTQFYISIQNLESTLLDRPNVSMIVFNSLTAFYWSEQGFQITKMDMYVKNVLNLIQKVTKEYKTICIFTRPEYFCSNKDSDLMSPDIKYQIRIINNENMKCQIIVKTTQSTSTRFFSILNGKIHWN